jgi:hypothetical protein
MSGAVTGLHLRTYEMQGSIDSLLNAEAAKVTQKPQKQTFGGFVLRLSHFFCGCCVLLFECRAILVWGPTMAGRP